MIDYEHYAILVEDSIRSKHGLDQCISNVTGKICHGIMTGIFTNKDAQEYFKILEDTHIGSVPTDHQWHRLVDMLPPHLRNNPVTLYFEQEFGSYNGGRKAQIGPGEFIRCWYSQGSVFQTDNQKHADIIIEKLLEELKKANGNNDASPELFDSYAGKVDYLVGVHSVSDALKPNKRTQFIACEPSDWQRVFKFKLNKGKQPGDKRAWGLSTHLHALGN